LKPRSEREFFGTEAGLNRKILEQPMKRLYCNQSQGTKRSKEMAEISRLPIPVMEEWEWQYKGACRDLDPEAFFHPDGERGPRRRNREMAAKAVCATCPVIAACRAHALAVQEPYGIWGGLSEDDRAVILERQGVTPLTIPAAVAAVAAEKAVKTVSHAS
jgi:WhiB family redox-sensing transcriptional regulator